MSNWRKDRRSHGGCKFTVEVMSFVVKFAVPRYIKVGRHRIESKTEIRMIAIYLLRWVRKVWCQDATCMMPKRDWVVRCDFPNKRW